MNLVALPADRALDMVTVFAIDEFTSAWASRHQVGEKIGDLFDAIGGMARRPGDMRDRTPAEMQAAGQRKVLTDLATMGGAGNPRDVKRKERPRG